MKCLFISILCLIQLFGFIFTCKALDVCNFVDVRAYSMGNTLSVLPGFSNPASCGFKVSRYFSLQYINRYGVKELSTWAGTINYPNRYLNTGLNVSRFGMKAFHETSVSVNAYRKLSTFISLGIRVNYFNLHYSDKHPNKSSITADIGVLVLPWEHLYFSVLAINPFFISNRVGEMKGKSPSVLSVGLSYELSESFLLTGEVEKNFMFPVACKLGLEYNPVKELSIRAGMFTNPFTPSFGVGVHLLPFTVDFSFSKHSVLGFYSCCALQFSF